MHGEPSSLPNDAELLEEWVSNRRHEAFAQLVEHYQKLVLGAATRRTGDAESARDVAQQVFATLAAKAPLLAGRRNVGGWLYHVATHLGARAFRTERRRMRVENIAAPPEEAPSVSEPMLWDAVEDALLSLGEAEREAIVLHYLQDYSYPEMASALGIGEGAARKRVSRALQSLDTRLRSRGICRSASAVIAAIAAQQSVAPVSATAGLAAGAIASSGTTSTPFAILAHTIMTHTTTKLTAGLAAALLVPLALQWNANASLQREIDNSRAMHLEAPPQPAGNHTARLASLQTELAAKRTATMAAANKAAELAELKRKLETEVVYSMGTVESMARELARVSLLNTAMDTARAALEKARAKDPNSEETKRLQETTLKAAAEGAAGMVRGISLVREVLKIERSPEKAAHFYAAFLAETGQFDETVRAKVEARIMPWVADLQRDGLALPQRPRTIERTEWDQRRARATQTFIQSIAADFPEVRWDDFALQPPLGGGLDTEWLDLFFAEDDEP